MPPRIKPTEKWYNKPWPKVSGVTIVICTVFGMGFTTGITYSKNERTLDEIKIRSEYDIKMQQLIDDCRSEKTTEYRKISEQLESTINKMASKK